MRWLSPPHKASRVLIGNTGKLDHRGSPQLPIGEGELQSHRRVANIGLAAPLGELDDRHPPG